MGHLQNNGRKATTNICDESKLGLFLSCNTMKTDAIGLTDQGPQLRDRVLRLSLTLDWSTVAARFHPNFVAAVAEWYRYRTVACFVTGSSPVPLKTRRKLLGAVDTRRYPRAENRVWSDQEDHEEREDRRIVRQALVDPTVTRSTIRADISVAIVPQTISRHLAETNLKSKIPFRALPLKPEHRQLRLQWCQARSMWNVTD
ncbi:HTH_Tnp_Tc3_2 domain-containing protein [Trichonephila clavipes]|nr:HTH_Tnp_Tc3_2 domain-containing protein [Trichonephila clavipes]